MFVELIFCSFVYNALCVTHHLPTNEVSYYYTYVSSQSLWLNDAIVYWWSWLFSVFAYFMCNV